ncbi:hypothetical protein [Halosegnis marinus]|uniref:Uncharacterized protein n=1 Tax=Halosegnis marinus TaxID=3034023 RepID=A0ABD5ZKN3_9EURY|nr:hypothetical protein [Halosegnis sp. DT85]
MNDAGRTPREWAALFLLVVGGAALVLAVPGRHESLAVEFGYRGAEPYLYTTAVAGIVGSLAAHPERSVLGGFGGD